MRIKIVLLTALFLVFSSTGFTQSETPTFTQYAAEVETIKNIQVNLTSHKYANSYRTNLRKAAKEGVNFAGHYILTSWGCGTNCSQSAIIDARDGAVFFPTEFAGLNNGFCELPEVSDPTDAPQMPDDLEAPVLYKAASRLLVLRGYKGGDFNNKNGRCGVYYLEWTGTEFKQVKFVEGKRSETP